MSLEQTHREYVLEELLLDYLYDGEVPTADELEADFATYLETHPNLAQPVSKNTVFSVDRHDEASASLIHTIAETVSRDVGIATREIYRITEESQRFYDRWSAEMKRLAGLAKSVENEIDSLLLLTYDTAGFFAHVGDVFTDMNDIDTTLTTARVSLDEGAVTINPSVSSAVDSSGGTLVDLSALTLSNMSFSALSKRPGISYIPVTDLINIFKPASSLWLGTITCPTTGQMSSELKLEIGPGIDREVSKIAMVYTGPNATSNSTVTCQYSADGYTWYLVPTDDATKTLTQNLTWHFPLTTMRWVKFIFTKPSHDSMIGTSYAYEYGISYIRFYGHVYDTSEGNLFVSKGLQAKNTEDEAVLFSKVALDTCQEAPTNTEIDYYVAASKDGSTWTSWFQIVPSTTTDTLLPKVINFSGVDWTNNQDVDATTTFDSSLTGSTAPLKLTRDFGSYNGYSFKSADYAAINTAITISPDLDPDPISNSIVLWRNARYKNSLDYPDTATVRTSPRGWGFDGDYYSCYFEIVNSLGLTIDFGATSCIIDDQELSGVVTIQAGVHKFKTTSENWYDIAENLTTFGSDVLTEETLAREDIDPLYPYNHKLLVEGFAYSDSFTGNRVYRGTDISAEYYATRVSLFDLENKYQDSYGYFAVRGVGDSSSPTLAVILRYNASNTDYTNELCVLRWRAASSTASMYTSVKLKAVLDTSDTAISPVLTSYRVKLGV